MSLRTKFVWAIAVLCAVAIFPAIADDLPMNDCDRLAASDSDPDRKGRGVPLDQIDAVAAIKACQEVISKYPDNPRLNYQLARAFYSARDFDNAFKHYEFSAEHGYAPAQNNFGSMLMDGEGSKQDAVAGLSWIRKSAEQRNPIAEANLGTIYFSGHGVPRDTSAAIAWYRKAAADGNTGAADILTHLPEACPDQNNDGTQRVALADLFIDLNEHINEQVVVDGADISAAGNNGAILRSGNLTFLLDGSSMERETYRFLLQHCSGFTSSNTCKFSVKVVPTGEVQNVTQYPILSCGKLIR